MSGGYREKPRPASAEAWLAIQKAKAGGGLISGGQLEEFRYGWALPILGGARKAHFFTLAGDVVESDCGIVWEPKLLYGPGNFPRCKRCTARLDRDGQCPL